MVDQRFPTRQRTDAIPLPAGLLPEAERTGDWHLEEERRLFYVAMTRAKDGLFLTSADDYGGARKRKLSRFMAEADFAAPRSPEVGVAEDWLMRAAAKPATDKAAPFVIHLPKQFSFTQLTAFRTCPLQYKYAHVLKIPVFGKWTFSFGKTMHNALHQFFLRWIERTSAQQGSLFAPPTAIAPGAVPVSREELMRFYEDAWIDEWYADDQQREEYRRRGRLALADYHGKLTAAPPEPLALEQSFTLKFGPVVIKGRIDRIDRLADGVRIIDYKTGKPKKAETLERGDKEQLFLYQIAAKEVLGLEPKMLTYHYLEDNSEVDFFATPEELNKLREEIVERVEKIRHSAFSATPGFHCRFCDFNDICEYRLE
jgi:DNA helicase-2/ATP-dependent DNA helicase PcrA